MLDDTHCKVNISFFTEWKKKKESDECSGSKIQVTKIANERI